MINNIFKLRFNLAVHNGNRDMEIFSDHIDIFTNKPRERNQANYDIIKQLSRRFNVNQSCIKIVSGATSRHKVIEIIEG